jgi:ribosome-binding ATPase YchF (GTP1/OBG family)
MAELGIAESGLDRVIGLSYELLGLISFLTAGPDEVRAWPIPAGSTGVDAAAAIHTDLAKGFIRAETVAYEDLLRLGSMADARKAGRLRSEGRTYPVKDGDVLEILFSR